MTTKKLESDEITKLLISDPKDVPETQIVAGWLGKDTKAGCWRLYQDPTFASYIEISEADVVVSKRLDERIAPLGGTVLWVKRDAKLPHTRLTPSRAQMGFLSGQISRDHMGRVASNFTIGDDTAFHPTIIITITVVVTTTIIVIVSTATDRVCPNPDNSAALCPTNASHCC